MASEKQMMKPFSRKPGCKAGVLACSALLFACSGNVGGPVPNGAGTSASTGGTGNSAGSSTGGTGPVAGASTMGGNGSSAGSTGVAGSTAVAGSAGSVGSAGSAGGPIDIGVVVPDPPPFQPAAGLLRRLTRTQFRNAVRDVFGVEVDVNLLDPDSYNGNFAAIGAASVVTSERGVEQYHAAIENAVDTVFADDARRATFLGCEPSGTPGDACLRTVLESKGRRAWRRPLDTTEVDRLVVVAETAASELGSPIEGARWATVALFTSPNFLYRAELGNVSGDGSLRYAGHEMAARLAFLVWNSLPDDALLDEGVSGALATAENVRAAVERLLDAPAGRQAVGAFAEEYMRLDRIEAQAKDATLYPEYGKSLQAAMVRDMKDTWEAIAFDDRSSALELFSTPRVVVNASLAQLYGIDAAGLDETTFAARSLPGDSPRVGILGKAGFLSQFANQKEGSPTLRGKFMREALMCAPIDPPPGNVDVVLEDPPADQPLTKRDRLEAHRANPKCSGCHSLMDPLGLPLETFDAIGRYRTTDRGLTIDPSGDFDGVPVADARELGFTMSASAVVAQCLVRKYYSYAVGHEERDVDGSVLNALATSFQASGFQLRELILHIATHEAFSSAAPQP
jgi:hypothetical protein